MLDLTAIRATDMHDDPFPWGLARHAFASQEAARELARTFPERDYWFFDTRDIRWEARPLVVLGSDRRPPLAPLPPAWEELVDDLLAPAYRATLSEIIDRSLEGAPMEAVLRRFDASARLLPHRDDAAKIVTQVFYFASDWSPGSGGCLRILRSPDGDDVAAELPPLLGTASVLVRSESSWHSVSPVARTATSPRRTLTVTWWAPGSVSLAWRLGRCGRLRSSSDGVRRDPRLHPRRLAYGLRVRWRRVRQRSAVKPGPG